MPFWGALDLQDNVTATAPYTHQIQGHNADIRQIKPEDIRRNMGAVLQNPLFSGTIRDNLLMGKPDATDEELIESVRVAGADGFIALPGIFLSQKEGKNCPLYAPSDCHCTRDHCQTKYFDYG